MTTLVELAMLPSIGGFFNEVANLQSKCALRDAGFPRNFPLLPWAFHSHMGFLGLSGLSNTHLSPNTMQKWILQNRCPLKGSLCFWFQAFELCSGFRLPQAQPLTGRFRCVIDSRQGILGATPITLVELVLSARLGVWHALSSAWVYRSP